DRVRRDLASALDEEIVILPLAHIDAAATAPDDDAGSLLRDAQRGIVPGFARRDDRNQRSARVALRIGAVPGVPDVVPNERGHVIDRHIVHWSGDLARHL